MICGIHGVYLWAGRSVRKLKSLSATHGAHFPFWKVKLRPVSLFWTLGPEGSRGFTEWEICCLFLLSPPVSLHRCSGPCPWPRPTPACPHCPRAPSPKRSSWFPWSLAWPPWRPGPPWAFSLLEEWSVTSPAREGWGQVGGTEGQSGGGPCVSPALYIHDDFLLWSQEPCTLALKCTFLDGSLIQHKVTLRFPFYRKKSAVGLPRIHSLDLSSGPIWLQGHVLSPIGPVLWVGKWPEKLTNLASREVGMTRNFSFVSEETEQNLQGLEPERGRTGLWTLILPAVVLWPFSSTPRPEVTGCLLDGVLPTSWPKTCCSQSDLCLEFSWWCRHMLSVMVIWVVEWWHNVTDKAARSWFLSLESQGRLELRHPTPSL